MKAARIFIMVCMVILLSGMAKAGLVAYYDFNNQSDLKIDNSGTGKTLTLYDAEGDYSAEGVNGGCVDINATTQGYRSNYAAIFPAGDFSFSTWVKVEATSGMVIQPFNTEAGIAITIAADTYRFWIFRSTGTGAANVALNSGIAPVLNEWTHLAVTFDTDGVTDANGNYTGTFKYYINGVLKNTSTQVYSPVGYRGSNGLCIGRRATTYFNGKYDDMAMFDTALTDFEVGALASKLCTPLNAEGYTPAQTTSLVGYYSFDNSGALANDDSGNGLNLINDATYQAAGYTANGAVNGAAVFDGATQGYLGDQSLFPAGSFTVSLWSNVDTAGTTQMIARSYNSGVGYSIQVASGEYRLYTYISGTEYSMVRSFLYTTAGAWDHLALTFDSDGIPDASGNYTGTLTAYVNGVSVGSVAGAKYKNTGAAYLCFGRRATAFYDGTMDELAVFSGVLSELEIAALAQKQATPLDVIGYEPPAPPVNEYLPIAYYSFDDPNGVPYGMKLDDSGNGKNLTVYHAGSIEGDFSNDGIAGGSVDFNSTTQGYRAIYTDIYPDGNFTFATWVKTEGTSSMISTPFRTDGGYGISIASNTLRFWLYRSTGTGVTYTAINSAVAPIMNEWMHLAMTFETDGSKDVNGNYIGTLKYYINGVLKAASSQLYHPVGFRGDTLGMCIGKRGDTGATFFNGKYDDLAVWDVVLADWQIVGLVTQQYSPMTIPAAQVIAADLNGDGVVNLEDFGILAGNWLSSSF